MITIIVGFRESNDVWHGLLGNQFDWDERLKEPRKRSQSEQEIEVQDEDGKRWEENHFFLKLKCFSKLSAKMMWRHPVEMKQCQWGEEWETRWMKMIKKDHDTDHEIQC